MTSYPLSLALQNFMPVIISAAALWNLVRMLTHDGAFAARAAGIATVLIVAGGAAKALWKLAMAAWSVDAPLLSGALFPLLAPGFGLLALAVLRMPARIRVLGVAVISVVLAVAVAVAGGGGAWKMPLLTLLTAAMLACGAGLVLRARGQGDRIAAACVAFYVVASFALSGLAAAGAGTLALQWTEQIISTIGAAALLWAAVRMRTTVMEAIQ
jgi:hypothetical protein